MGCDTLKYFCFFARGGNLYRYGLVLSLGPLEAEMLGNFILSLRDRDL
jgi:hypothetical protein